MKPHNFEYLRKFLHETTGLVIGPDKAYLVDSRLVPVARRRNLNTLDELVERLASKTDASLRTEVTDAMMTNESFFFRDIAPFENFRRVVLPKIVEARRRAGRPVVRIWSAACSSGQEPYTLAMILKEESALLAGVRAEIVGTDLSTEIVAKAKAGIYSQFEVQRGLPVQLLVKYFGKVGDQWQIAEPLRSMINFRCFNLLDDLAVLGRFDVVFCRNVLIYFDNTTKASILRRIARTVLDDGVLYLGGAESPIGITDAFKLMPDMRGVYALARAA